MACWRHACRAVDSITGGSLEEAGDGGSMSVGSAQSVNRGMGRANTAGQAVGMAGQSRRRVERGPGGGGAAASGGGSGAGGGRQQRRQRGPQQG